MATTQNTYTGNNSTTDYSFTFPYIKEADVKVSLDAVVQTQDTDYTFANATTISFDTAPGTGVAIRIFRDTDLENAVTTFFAGSAIRAEDLNDNTNQVLFSAQERKNRDADKTGDTFTGDVTLNAANLVFEGATADDFETTLTVTDPTADRTITLPNQTGTVPVLAAASNTQITATPEELNTLDGITASTAELNLMDGVTATTAELNTMDGITATTAELNLMDGVTATTAEINFVDGVTSNVQTQLDNKQPLDAELTELATMDSATASALADLTGPEVQTIDGVTSTTDELNILDGVTATAAEINILDGVTSTTAELNILDGATVTATELNTLDGVNSTLTAADLNQLDSNTLSNNVTDWTGTTTFPSSAQVDARITARIDPIGGFEAIADEDSFPATAPPEGTIISIANAGGMVIGASASTTDATRAGGTDTVTIQNIPANMQSQTIQDGLGMLVIATSTAHTYDFHRVVATNADVIQLSNDINDFQARYRVGASNPTDSLDEGDLFYNTGSNTLLVYDGSEWGETQSIGQYFIIPAAELADFASGTASTEVISNAPANASQIILSINGVIQEPNTGTDAPTDGFALDGSTIRLAATPAANSDVWGVIIGSTVNIGEPSADTVDGTKIVDDAIDQEHIADNAVRTVHIQDDQVTAAKLADSTTTDADRAVTRNHIRDDAIDGTKIADDVALGGNPTTTTQTAGNNTTRIATTEFVTTAVGNISQDSITNGTSNVTVTNNAQTTITANSVEAAEFGTAEVVFNDSGADRNFRVEGDTEENLLFVDGGEDRVGIGTGTPTFTLDVVGTDAVQLPAGTDAERPTGLNANDVGIMRFNTTSGQFEYWANTDDTPQFRVIGDAPQRTIAVQYLVIAGGGSGGAGFQGGCGGGGGAGGYRTNFGTGNISGRLSAVEAAMTVNTGTALSLTVGAGGTAMTGNTNSTDIPAGSDGNDSTFNTITSIGGGAGGRNDGGHGNDGGCGGGAGGRLASATNGDGTANQGFDGGDCTQDNDLAAGGGGGAGEAGSTGITSGSPNLAQGGDGIASSITGSSVTRGGGGGSAGSSSSCTLNSNQSGGLGGAGGGGAGAAANSANGTAGTANTGGGGGGNLRNCSSSNAGAGGSGVIILRTATGVTARFSAGVVVNGTSVIANDTAVAGTVVGGGSTDLVWTVTAAASDTVTFS